MSQSAQTLFASSTIGTTLNVPAEYDTIQSAINTAVNGDTVLVAVGSYYENLTWHLKSINLIGAVDGADDLLPMLKARLGRLKQSN